MQEAIDISDIRAARSRLEGIAVRTPLLESPLLNERAGRRVLVKAECLQLTGAFKLRGAWSAISRLTDSERKNGVLAYSSGNHAQAIAWAAARAGIKAVIIMPEDAPALKIHNTRSYGAEVVLYDRAGGENREALGQTLAADRGLYLIKPYDNAMVMAGQGTCGLEIAEQAADAAVSDADVLVCCGGGGLTSGIAIALEADAPTLKARPVEPESSDDVARSLSSGSRQQNDGPPTSICDAIVTPSPGELTFPIMNRLCKSGLTVSDDESLMAIATALQTLKIALEPGGAVALAAALYRSNDIEGDAVICVASGGNTDPQILARAIALSGQG